MQEEPIMNDDNLLLQEIVTDHNITVKQLAILTGLSAPAIYRYLAGTNSIPTIIWRVLYARTRDQRITELFIGDVPVVVIDLTDTSNTDSPAVLADLIAQRRLGCEVEQCILEILADGKINARDRRAINDYRKALPESLRQQHQLFQRIDAQFKESLK